MNARIDRTSLGAPVQALRAGVVVSVGEAKGCGMRTQVRDETVVSTYCNPTGIAVAKVQEVAAGAPGGKTHLRFEVQADGKHVDPMTVLPKAASAG